MSLHLAADTTNYQDTFDFKEIDGYYTISLTTSSGTFYIGEQFMPISSIPTHTVIMDEIVCPQCEFPYYFQWEIFKTDSGYSIRNAESQYFLCGTGGELRTANLDAILDSPAAYPCTWNIADPASNELHMPLNLNQKYTPTNLDKMDQEDQDRYTTIYRYGCMSCSYADIVAYYTNQKYTILDIFKNGWSDDNGFAHQPNAVKYGVKFTTKYCSTESAYLAEIKESIDLGRPAILHFGDVSGTTDKTESHYVVAYKYINGCVPTPGKPLSNVYVLDPYNADENSEIGSIRTAYEAQKASYCGPIDQILLSAPYTS